MTDSYDEVNYDHVNYDYNQVRYTKAISAIDAVHALDPKKITVDGLEVPYELHYAQRCTYYLARRCPMASEILILAIRAQHFRRWEVPRNSYPMTRVGYLTWRTHLKKRQADCVERILDVAGYSSEDTLRVKSLIRKEHLKKDHETQVLEDVACLVFLDDQFEQFEKEHDEEKIINILRKTWAKMTEEGRELALKIRMSARSKELVEKALEEKPLEEKVLEEKAPEEKALEEGAGGEATGGEGAGGINSIFGG